MKGNKNKKKKKRGGMKKKKKKSGGKKNKKNRCDICTGGRKPRFPNVVTRSLYVKGYPTCIKLYKMGRAGKIPERMCNPMRLFYHGPCGCGK